MAFWRRILCAIILTGSWMLVEAADSDPCNSTIFCTGKILHAVQTLEIYPDGKTFVDLPLKVSPADALENFNRIVLDQTNKDQIRQFLNVTFESSPGVDVIEYKPNDWKNVSSGGLSLYSNITDKKYQALAVEIHEKWTHLTRKVAPSVEENPDQHSLIYVPNAFVIPGGRYREMFYWDSFWTVQGLLVSGMAETSKGIMENFIYLIEEFGFMPNGNRVYFEKRSQPPFLALLADMYRRHPSIPESDSTTFIKDDVLPALEREYKFWMANRRAPAFDYKGKRYDSLNIYKGGMNQPRPESYREDVNLFNVTSPENKGDLYAHIGAACESGLDFSSRWLDTYNADFSTIRTETIVPVDLNALLCAQERIMSEFYNLTGDGANSEKYKKLARTRADDIHAVFWNEEKNMWRDYDLKLKKQRDDFYLTHIVPLFAKCSGAVDITTTEFMKKLLNSPDIKSVTSHPGGFPVSLGPVKNNHTQWDYPNAWPPLQMMLIEAFAANPDTRASALEWAQKAVKVVHTGFGKSNAFFEKYDVREVGKYGAGGEYKVQEGFGWTNGGVLRLLELFPKELKSGVASGAVCNFLLILTSIIAVWASKKML